MIDTTKIDIKIIEDFCKYHSYPKMVSSTDAGGKIVEVENPESKPDFTDRLCREFIKNSVISYRANKAAEDARVAEVAKEVII